MSVLYIFDTVLVWVIWLIGWILSLPLRGLCAILRFLIQETLTEERPFFSLLQAAFSSCFSYQGEVIFRFTDMKTFPPRTQPAPEYQALQNQLENLLRDFKHVSRKYSSSEERLEVLTSERDELRRKNKQLSDKLEMLQRNGLHLLDKHEQAVATERDDMREEINQLEKKVKVLHDEIERLKKSDAEKDLLLEQRENEIDTLLADLKDTRDSKDEMDTVLRTAQDELKKFKEEMGQLENSLKEEISKYEAVESENKILRQQSIEVDSREAVALTSLT